MDIRLGSCHLKQEAYVLVLIYSSTVHFFGFPENGPLTTFPSGKDGTTFVLCLFTTTFLLFTTFHAASAHLLDFSVKFPVL